jgi:hypothetical protein
MYPISTLKKWVIIMWPTKNISTWEKKWEVLKSIHSPPKKVFITHNLYHFKTTAIQEYYKYPKYFCTTGHT